MNISTPVIVREVALRDGLDFEQLIALRACVAEWLEGETLHGTVWRAALPKTMGRKRQGRPGIEARICGRSREVP